MGDRDKIRLILTIAIPLVGIILALIGINYQNQLLILQAEQAKKEPHIEVTIRAIQNNQPVHYLDRKPEEVKDLKESTFELFRCYLPLFQFPDNENFNINFTLNAYNSGKGTSEYLAVGVQYSEAYIYQKGLVFVNDNFQHEIKGVFEKSATSKGLINFIGAPYVSQPLQPGDKLRIILEYENNLLKLRELREQDKFQDFEMTILGDGLVPLEHFNVSYRLVFPDGGDAMIMPFNEAIC